MGGNKKEAACLFSVEQCLLWYNVFSRRKGVIKFAAFLSWHIFLTPFLFFHCTLFCDTSTKCCNLSLNLGKSDNRETIVTSARVSFHTLEHVDTLANKSIIFADLKVNEKYLSCKWNDRTDKKWSGYP